MNILIALLFVSPHIDYSYAVERAELRWHIYVTKAEVERLSNDVIRAIDEKPKRKKK
jgi:hypothetical protein